MKGQLGLTPRQVVYNIADHKIIEYTRVIEYNNKQCVFEGNGNEYEN